MGGPGGLDACARCAAPRARGTAPEAERPQPASDHGRGGTPGPIPNPEVKPPSADGTAGIARGRPGRRWPTGGVSSWRGPAPSAGPLSVFRVRPGAPLALGRSARSPAKHPSFSGCCRLSPPLGACACISGCGTGSSLLSGAAWPPSTFGAVVPMRTRRQWRMPCLADRAQGFPKPPFGNPARAVGSPSRSYIFWHDAWLG